MFSIYKITSPSGKSYIGLSKNALRRFEDHKKASENGSKTKFYDAIRKYGFENFVFEILVENIETKIEANCSEIFYISFYNTFGKNSNGYNMTKGGDGTSLFGSQNGMFGKTHSDEVKKKLSLNKKGKKSFFSLENRTQEEIRQRNENSSKSRKENFLKLTNLEQEEIKQQRSERTKEVWKNYDMSESIKSLKYWDYKTEEELKIINLKKSKPKDQNGRALFFILKSPENEEFIVSLREGLKNFCEKKQLAFYAIEKSNGEPLKSPLKNNSKYLIDKEYKFLYDNSLNWSCKKFRRLKI